MENARSGFLFKICLHSNQREMGMEMLPSVYNSRLYLRVDGLATYDVFVDL